MSDVVDRVVGIVEHNTGHKQPNTIDLTHISVTASNAGLDRDEVVEALDEAVEQGRLEETDVMRYRVDE